MAEPKYLRSISVWPDEVIETIRGAEVHHIPDLLQRALLPLPSPGIAKINVRFVSADGKPGLEAALGVSTIRWPFDCRSFSQQNPRDQRTYYLNQLRDALAFAADRYGWDKTKLHGCCERIMTDDFRAEWW